MRAPFLAIAVALVVVGCADRPPPSPFGKLGERSGWAGDCDRPLVSEPTIKGPDAMMIGRRYRELAFQAATQTLVCGAPGWTLYTDDSDRVVGICVDNRLSRLRRDGSWESSEEHTTRARALIARHYGEALATDITEGRCDYKPERVPHGLVRWEQSPAMVRTPVGWLEYPPPTGSDLACCWEVISP